MSKNKKKRTAVVTVSALVGVVLLGAAGVFGTNAYQNYLEDKVYSVDETVKYPEFKLDITKAEVKPVNLPIEDELIDEHGGIDEKEDCSRFSDTPRQEASIEGSISNPTSITPYEPSDRVFCVRRNNSRDDIKEYTDKNKQLVVDYKITAKESVDTSKINIELLPDSGRKLDERVHQFNGNQFMKNNDFSHEILPPMVEYVPYHQSNIGGNIGKDLTRTGYLYTDVRNSEDSVDFILTYNQGDETHSRTIRISLN